MGCAISDIKHGGWTKKLIQQDLDLSKKGLKPIKTMHARRNPLFCVAFSWRSIALAHICSFSFNCIWAHTCLTVGWDGVVRANSVHLHTKYMIQVHDLASSKQSELVLLTNVTYVHLHESNSEFGMGFQISWNGYSCCSKWQQCLYDRGFTKLHFEWMTGKYKWGRNEQKCGCL